MFVHKQYDMRLLHYNSRATKKKKLFITAWCHEKYFEDTKCYNGV